MRKGVEQFPSITAPNVISVTPQQTSHLHIMASNNLPVSRLLYTTVVPIAVFNISLMLLTVKRVRHKHISSVVSQI